MSQRPVQAAIKRAADIVLAGFALFICMPAIGLIALAIALTLGRPVLFAQGRSGIGGRTFRILKFRTMKLGSDPDAARLTRLGRFLRSTSLDELPELLCVLRGEMSIVGPRPLVPEYLPLYSAEQGRRHEMKPGITGWAQVNGRNSVSWEQRFRLDVWYVDNWTLWLDFKIILVTILRVLTRADITAPGQATMHRFTGSGSLSN